MIPVFQRGITAAGEEAVTADSLEKLNSINTFYLAQARLLGIATAVNQLDAETVKSQVPFKVVITKVEASPTLIPGDGTTQLRVSGGYQLGTNPVKTSPNFAAEVSLVGGTSPDLPSQPSLQNTGQAIFNLVRLSELSERITGTAVGHFAHFAVAGAQPFTSEPFNFAIEGQLSITLAATSQGSDATLTARVRKGNAPVSNAVVSFVKLSGAGAVNPSAMTNAEGVVTGTVTGIDDSTQVRASVSHAGQNASAEVSVSRDGEPLPENYGLVAFGYLVGLEPNHPMYNVQMRLLLRFEGEQIVEGDFGGGMIGAINFINADFVRVSISNHVLTFETEPDLLPTFWSGSIDLPSSRPGTLPYRGTFTFSFPDNAGSGTYDVELDELIFTDEEGLPL